jgi:hypothetical protein
LIVQIPSSRHHFLEVSVIIDAATDIFVVLLEFLASHNAVSGIAVSVVVVLLKG